MSRFERVIGLDLVWNGIKRGETAGVAAWLFEGCEAFKLDEEIAGSLEGKGFERLTGLDG